MLIQLGPAMFSPSLPLTGQADTRSQPIVPTTRATATVTATIVRVRSRSRLPIGHLPRSHTGQGGEWFEVDRNPGNDRLYAPCGRGGEENRPAATARAPVRAGRHAVPLLERADERGGLGVAKPEADLLHVAVGFGEQGRRERPAR